VTHLLDTSAILVHFLDEPGADQVEALLAGGTNVAGLAAPSWVELDRRLYELIPDAAEAARVLRHYTRSLCGFVALDEAAVLAAMKIRHGCASRLPLVDALIPGCAACHRLTLVHRDKHMDAIPSGHVVVIRLPDRVGG
jgi:predicted nucleic acid-binding protein